MTRLATIVLTLAAGLMPIAAQAATPVVPEQSMFIAGLDEDSMRVRLSELPLQPLEGIWYYPAEAMTLGIERCDAQCRNYRIVLLASEDLELLPGTIIGHIVTGAVDNKFSLWLYSQRDHTLLIKPLECVATLNATATSITFDPPHWEVKLRMNFVRFLPTIFRGMSMVPQLEKDKLPIGFKKVYPDGGNGDRFTTIRYL